MAALALRLALLAAALAALAALAARARGLEARALPTVEVALRPEAAAGGRAARELAREARGALADVGAAFVRVRGAPARLGARGFAAARRVFAEASAQEKAALQVNDRGFTRGFVPLAGESGSRAVEVKEAFSMGYDWDSDHDRRPGNGLEGHNLWPEDLGPAHEARRALQGLFGVFTATASALVRQCLVQIPGLEDLDERTSHAETISLLRVFHYFGNATAAYEDLGCARGANCTGSSPHTDWGLLTLILLEDQDGLDALHFATDEGWVRVRPAPSSPAHDGQEESLLFLVNVGDFLALSSRFAIRSPLHRVALSARDRYSFVFFAFPNFDAPVPDQGLDDSPEYRSKRARVSLLQDQSKSGDQGDPVQAPKTFGELIMRKWAQVQRQDPGYGMPVSATSFATSFSLLIVGVTIIFRAMSLSLRHRKDPSTSTAPSSR